MKDCIRGVYIKVSPFEFISIIKYKDIKMVNEHNVAEISGYIDKENEENYLELASKDKLWVNMEIFDENKSNFKTLFIGVLTAFKIQSKNKLKLLTIEIKISTILMDTNLHIKSHLLNIEI